MLVACRADRSAALMSSELKQVCATDGKEAKRRTKEDRKAKRKRSGFMLYSDLGSGANLSFPPNIVGCELLLLRQFQNRIASSAPIIRVLERPGISVFSGICEHLDSHYQPVLGQLHPSSRVEKDFANHLPVGRWSSGPCVGICAVRMPGSAAGSKRGRD